MSEAKTLLAKKVNLKTLTIFTKILILDDWLVPGRVPMQIDILISKDRREKMESF